LLISWTRRPAKLHRDGMRNAGGFAERRFNGEKRLFQSIFDLYKPVGSCEWHIVSVPATRSRESLYERMLVEAAASIGRCHLEALFTLPPIWLSHQEN